MPNNSKTERETWMKDLKDYVRNVRSNYTRATGMDKEELEPILGNSVTILFDKVQASNPMPAVVLVEGEGYVHVQTNDKGTNIFPGAYGTASIQADGRGSLSAKTNAFMLPHLSRAPMNRRESAEQREARQSVNEYVINVFAEEGLWESAKAVQASQIIPAIHHHEDGSTKPCVYIMADNVFTGLRGRLEVSRSQFMQPSEDLPGSEEEASQDELTDELVDSLLG